MQPTFSEIKKAARGALKHRWPEAIIVSVVLIATLLLNTFMQYMLMSIFKVKEVWTPFTPTDLPIYSQFASVGITLFSAVFSFLVIFPLTFGVMRWFWAVTGGSSVSVGDIFYYFSCPKIFFKTLGLSIRLYIMLVIGAIVCFLPYILLGIATSPYLYDSLGVSMPIFMNGLLPLVSFFKLFGFLALLMWISVYLMCYTVIFSEPELSAGKTISRTVKVTKGFRFNTVGFFFSFFGWLLLSLLAVPLIFTVPYLLASFAVYGREVYRASKHTEQQSF